MLYVYDQVFKSVFMNKIVLLVKFLQLFHMISLSDQPIRALSFRIIQTSVDLLQRRRSSCTMFGDENLFFNVDYKRWLAPDSLFVIFGHACVCVCVRERMCAWVAVCGGSGGAANR